MSQSDSRSRPHSRANERVRRKMVRRVDKKKRRLARAERKLQRKFGRSEPPDDRYRAARRVANLKVSVAVHALSYTMVLALLLRVAGFRVMVIVGLSWGIGLALHYFVGFVLPDLRRRWIEEQVTEGVSRQRESSETRRERSLEDLSASIAHEIRNPISAAKSLVQQMGEDPLSGENIGFAGVALNELDRVERSISHLLRFARDEELRFDGVALGDIVDSAIDTFRERLRSGDILVERQLDVPGWVRGDAEKLRRVVINLIGNAIEAVTGVRDAGRIDVTVGRSLSGREVWLRVRDDGVGISEADRARIFDPFYTTKGEGTGLGLALSRKIIEAHGGELEISSMADGGTEAIVTLPARGEPS